MHEMAGRRARRLVVGEEADLVAHAGAPELRLGAHEMVVCGMALGHADPDAIANRLVTARAGVEEFAVFHDAAPEPMPPAAGASQEEKNR